MSLHADCDQAGRALGGPVVPVVGRGPGRRGCRCNVVCRLSDLAAQAGCTDWRFAMNVFGVLKGTLKLELQIEIRALACGPWGI